MRHQEVLALPSCGRAAAERILRQRFPRVPLPDAVRIMRDRRLRKAARSSQKAQWKRGEANNG